MLARAGGAEGAVVEVGAARVERTGTRPGRRGGMLGRGHGPAQPARGRVSGAWQPERKCQRN